MTQNYFVIESFGNLSNRSLSSVSVNGRCSETSSQVSQYLWSTMKRSYAQRRTGDILLSYTIAAIISDAAYKLDLITSVINEEIDPLLLKLDFYKPPVQRFAEKKEFEGNFKRWKRYSCFLREILKASLNTTDDASVIDKVVKRFRRQDRDEKLLIEEHAVNKKRLEEMRKALGNVKNENKQRLNDKDDELQRIQKAYDGKLAYSLVEKNYIKAYEKDRCYLRNFSDNAAERKLRNELDKYNVQIAQENRIHSEIEEYLESYVIDMEEETRKWIGKCDTDEEKIDQKISEAKEEKYLLELHHLEVERKYRQRCEEMEDWLARREKIIQDEEHSRLRNIAATTIQAWWRGEMQRKHLGPFSDNRKPRKAKAKGKIGRKGKKLKK